MKRFFFAALLLASSGHTALYSTGPARAMADWYAEAWPGTDPGFVYSVGVATEAYADLLGMSQAEVEVMLSMWHRESAYSMLATGGANDPDSFGLCQTRKSDIRKFRAFWAERRVKIGKSSEADTQVAYGVAEFYGKVGEAEIAHTDIWDAVRRYNGSGRDARRYAHRVYVTYCKVFHHPRRLK